MDDNRKLKREFDVVVTATITKEERVTASNKEEAEVLANQQFSVQNTDIDENYDQRVVEVSEVLPRELATFAGLRWRYDPTNKTRDEVESLITSLVVLREDCLLALSGEWDKSDAGFKDSLAMIEQALLGVGAVLC